MPENTCCDPDFRPRASTSTAGALPLGVIIPLLGLAIFWAVEDFLVQGAAFDVAPSYHHPYAYQAIRFSLNLAFATGALLLIPRKWIVPIMCLDFLLSSVILAYARYFHEPITIQALRAAKEGVKVAGFGIQVVPGLVWAMLVGALVLKIVWVWRLKPPPPKIRWGGSALSAAYVAAALIVLQFGSWNLPSVAYIRGATITFAYGYPITWMAQAILGPDLAEIAAEIHKMRQTSPDRLDSSKEPPWPIGDRIAIVQLESFEWNVLNYKINGQEVTPFLNRLARESRLFKIHAYHSAGSADMDFAVLSGGPPDPRIINYSVPGISYSNALPDFMRRHGYQTASFHNNGGGFFNRRINFNRMGFDEIWFKDEFKDQPMKRSSWGLRDSEIFRLSSQSINARPRVFHFLITVDSHVPYDLIEEDEKEIFPGSNDWRENYFNSIRLLDNNVRTYVNSLPDQTLVIVYGDHSSGVTYGDFSPAREGSNEYVPCIVHCKGDTTWFKEADPSSDPADLRILDVINFFRREVSKAGPPAAIVGQSRFPGTNASLD